MLERAMPFALVNIHNPLFDYGIRRIRWGRSLAQLRRFTWRVFVAAHTVFLGLWVIWLLSVWPYYRIFGASASNILGESLGVVGMLMVASIAADVLLDLACLGFTLFSISGEVYRGRWDVLRLTDLGERSIVEAKYGVAQVRAWRVMALVFSTRVVVVVLGLLTTIVLPYFIDPDLSLLSDLAEGFRSDPFSVIGILATLVVFWSVFMIEPFWRMRALTALGIALSARVRNLTLGILAVFGVTLLVWIVQAVIMATLLWLTFSTVGASSRSPFLAISCVFGGCILTGWIIYAFYQRLQHWSLERAVRWIS